MIIKYENFVNESFFSKTFDERIDKINKLLIDGRRISAVINTNYQDEILDYKKINKYYTKFNTNLYNLSKELNSIIIKHAKSLSKEQMDIFIKKLKDGIKLFGVGSYNMKKPDVKYNITKALEEMNSVLFALDYLKSSKYYDYDIDFVTSYEAYVDSLVFIPNGNFVDVVRKSVLSEKEKKAREEHKDVDPYNEEKWVDEAVRWYYKGKLELDKDLDTKKISTTTDDIISVGDIVEVEGNWNGRKFSKQFQNNVGEVVRIFVVNPGYDERIIQKDNGREIDIVVKFEGRRDLDRSKFSDYHDCAKFESMQRRGKIKTNVYTQRGNYYDPGIKITKIKW